MVKKIILVDLISLMAVIMPLCGSAFLLDQIREVASIPLPWQILLALFLIPFSYMVLIGLSLRLLPQLKPGRVELQNDNIGKIWALYFFIKRPLQWHIFREFFHSSYLLRWFYYKSLRSKIAFSATLASGAEIRDPAMFRCGKNVSVGAETIISSHLIKDKTLYLAEVSIEDSVTIGGGCVIGPGTSLGRNSLIGYGTFISTDVRIGEGVVIGSHCKISEGVEIGAGSIIKDHVILPRKKIIGNQEIVKF